MSHIFISYSRKDIDFAQKIVDALAANGLDTWIDWKSIPGGEDWEQEIYRGIEEADTFLFLLSSDSAASEMCNREIAHAVKNGKRILPVFVANVDKQQIFSITEKILGWEQKEEIKRRNFIFCRQDFDDFSKAVEEIQKTIHSDYEWLKYHTELQVKALKWERKRDTSRLLRGKELREAEQQLAEVASQADPQPTKIQREYILASQRNEIHTRRLITMVLMAGLAIMALLVVFAWTERTTAVLQSDSRATAESNAVSEANARATAQANAEEQANIAIARQLAAKASSIFDLDPTNQTAAGILAIQSLKMMPNYEASVLLQSMTFSAPIAHIEQTPTISPVAFGPDSKFVAYGGVNTLNVWDFNADRMFAQMEYEGRIDSITFTSNGKYLVTSGCDATHCSVQIWDVLTGKKIKQIIQVGDDDRFRAAPSFTVSPNGKYVAISNFFHPVSIWEIPTGQEISSTTHTADSVAFSPDGKYLASSGSTTLSVWEFKTDQEIFRIEDTSLGGPVAFSPDGRYVVSGGSQSEPGATARVWEVATGLEVSRMTHSCSNVESAAFSPDGKYVVSGSCDGTARVWRTFSGTEIARMTHESMVKYAAFSPDGMYVVSAGYQEPDRTARLWDANTGKEVVRLVHGTGVYEVAFSPDGKYIVSSGCEEEKAFNECLRSGVSVWRVKGAEVLHLKHEDDGSWLDIQVSPDGKYIASKGLYSIQVWNMFTGDEVLRLTDEAAFGKGFAISPDSKYIAAQNWGWEVERDSGVSSSMIRVWEISSGDEINRIYTESDLPLVSFSPDGKYIIAKDDFGERTGGIWESATPRMITPIYTYGRSSPVEFSPNRKYAAALTTGDSVSVWDTSSGKEISQIQSEDGLYIFKFSPTDDLVLKSIGFDNQIHVWDIMTGEEAEPISLGSDPQLIPDTFSSDGKYVLLHTPEYVYSVWETTGGGKVSRLTLDSNIFSILFSPDGRYIVSEASTNTKILGVSLRVWKADTGEEIAPLAYEGDGPSTVFTPDGNYWTTAYSATIHIWDIAAKKELNRILQDNLNNFTFSPDGKYLVSADFDHTIRVWLWQPNDLLASGCSRVSRNLTYAEWQQYIGDTLPYQAVCPNLPIEREVLATPTP